MIFYCQLWKKQRYCYC